MANFLDLTGLTRFWSKAKSYIDSSISSAKTTVGNYTVNGKKISTNPTISKSDVGLSNVTNDAQVKRSEIGKANGVVPLEEDLKIHSSLLPSSVKNVLEYHGIVRDVTIQLASTIAPVDVHFDMTRKGFVVRDANFKYYSSWAEKPGIPASEAFGTSSMNGVIPAAGKIYVDTTTNQMFKWDDRESALVGLNTVMESNLQVYKTLFIGDTSGFLSETEGSIILTGNIINHSPGSGSQYAISEGNASFSGRVTCKSLTQTSDERLKENIYPISTDTEKINGVEFKEFNFVEDTSGRKSYGVLAQDLERVGLENLVYENEEGIKSVDYISLVMLELQRLRNEIKELKATM